MQSSDVRQKFLKYFETNGHAAVPSSRLVPENDPTLLFTNAGMNQFKNLFLGLETRPYRRAVTSQKCVRAGGKHNDLENVGHTARHHTFFEMLGNFSFGDYFKTDAIHFAWDLLTREFGLPKDRLYVTVFQDDDEAAEIWHRQEGVPKERIYRFGEKDNFWRMGDAGPCGPCSEIFYDLGPDVGGDPNENKMGGEGDRFMEIWNLVFMQYNEDGKGGRSALPKPSVDTGGGLERWCTVLQGKLNNYDTDLFRDIINGAARRGGVEYVENTRDLVSAELRRQTKINTALRVLADHARAATFLIADGVLPSNEGRGYVLRRIMRRAIRYGRQLTEDQSLLPSAVDAVIKKMNGFFGELNERRSLIERTVADEEKRFLVTLDQGTAVLTGEMNKLAQGGTLSGAAAFKLYDTYGFPLDLTRLMVSEQGFHVDELGFEKNLRQAKEKARASWKGKGLSGSEAAVVQFTEDARKKHGETSFNGYDTSREGGARALAMFDGNAAVDHLASDAEGLVILDRTCFYAEGGGQIGDRGVIHGPAGQLEVLDTTKDKGLFIHHVRVTDGVVRVGDSLELVVNTFERRDTANNHSATHLMHAALRKVLGTHLTQAGSLVEPDRLRFDFTHGTPVSADEIERVEGLVNDEIAKGIQVGSEVMSHSAALARGAMALFGEKYGAEVRVVQMGDFSMELCGGIHVGNTAQIRFFKIVGESGVSAGVRRIEAITGERAAEYLNQLSREALEARAAAGLTLNFAKYLEGEGQRLPRWIHSVQESTRAFEREVQSLKSRAIDADALLKDAVAFDGGHVVFAEVAVDDRKVLSELSDKLRDKLGSAVVVILGQGEASHPLVVTVSKSLNPARSAGKILAEVAAVLGGKGGGRPDFAQGAVPSRENLAEAKARLHQTLGISPR